MLVTHKSCKSCLPQPTQLTTTLVIPPKLTNFTLVGASFAHEWGLRPKIPDALLCARQIRMHNV